VRSLNPAGKDWRPRWLHSHHLDRWFAGFKHLSHARDGSTSPHPGYHNINLPIRIAPDFLGGCPAVDFGIGGIVKLPDNQVSRITGCHFLGAADGSPHAFRARRQDEFCAISTQEHAALPAHGLRHYQGTAIAAGCTDKCQRDTGVPTGGFKNDRILPDQPGLLGSIHHGNPNAILNTVGRVEIFQLGGNLCQAAICQVA